MPSDLAHWFGQDLNVAASGDLLTVTGIPQGQQRVLRRLLTNPGDYIWEPGYGAGLARYIGQPVDPAQITAIVRAQMALEPSVARDPQPTVNVTSISNGLYVQVQYTDSDSGQVVPLSFTVTPPGTSS